MGMTLEEAIKYYENKNVVLTEEEALANTIALNTIRKYQQLQADYEARLRADLVAMLTEIQLEIEELDSRAGYSGNGMPTFSTDYIRKKKVHEVIEQKINELNAESEG